MVAEVIINSTAKKLNRTFDYNIPKELENMIFVGSKVLVPFGRFKNLEEAHVVAIKQSSEFEIKDIAKVETGLTPIECDLLYNAIELQEKMQIMAEEELYFKGGMDAYYYFKRLGIIKV